MATGAATIPNLLALHEHNVGPTQWEALYSWLELVLRSSQ